MLKETTVRLDVVILGADRSVLGEHIVKANGTSLIALQDVLHLVREMLEDDVKGKLRVRFLLGRLLNESFLNGALHGNDLWHRMRLTKEDHALLRKLIEHSLLR